MTDRHYSLESPMGQSTLISGTEYLSSPYVQRQSRGQGFQMQDPTSLTPHRMHPHAGGKMTTGVATTGAIPSRNAALFGGTGLSFQSAVTAPVPAPGMIPSHSHGHGAAGSRGDTTTAPAPTPMGIAGSGSTGSFMSAPHTIQTPRLIQTPREQSFVFQFDGGSLTTPITTPRGPPQVFFPPPRDPATLTAGTSSQIRHQQPTSTMSGATTTDATMAAQRAIPAQVFTAMTLASPSVATPRQFSGTGLSSLPQHYSTTLPYGGANLSHPSPSYYPPTATTPTYTSHLAAAMGRQTAAPITSVGFNPHVDPIAQMHYQTTPMRTSTAPNPYYAQLYQQQLQRLYMPTSLDSPMGHHHSHAHSFSQLNGSSLTSNPSYYSTYYRGDDMYFPPSSYPSHGGGGTSRSVKSNQMPIAKEDPENPGFRRVPILGQPPRTNHVNVATQFDRTPKGLRPYLVRARRLIRLQGSCYICGIGQAVSVVVEVVEQLKREKTARVEEVKTSIIETNMDANVRPTMDVKLSAGDLGHLVSDFRRRKVIEVFELVDAKLVGELNEEQLNEMDLPSKFHSDDERKKKGEEYLKERDNKLNLPDFIHYCSILIHPLLLEYHFKQAIHLLGGKVDLHDGPLPAVPDEDESDGSRPKFVLVPLSINIPHHRGGGGGSGDNDSNSMYDDGSTSHHRRRIDRRKYHEYKPKKKAITETSSSIGGKVPSFAAKSPILSLAIQRDGETPPPVIVLTATSGEATGAMHIMDDGTVAIHSPSAEKMRSTHHQDHDDDDCLPLPNIIREEDDDHHEEEEEMNLSIDPTTTTTTTTTIIREDMIPLSNDNDL